MSSTSEVGHAKNVSNLLDLIAIVNGYGSSYAPTAPSLSVSALQSLHAAALATLDDVRNKSNSFNKAINDRVAAFADLRLIATRMLAALKATGVSTETYNDAKGYNRKLQGKRSKSLQPVPEGQPVPATISVSQQSYDQLIEHYSNFLTLLQSIPGYNPSEPDLTITSLLARLQTMTTTNNAVSVAYAAIAAARIIRNEKLYAPNTGLVDISNLAKDYVKSIYGAGSPEYKVIRAIIFRARA